MKIDLHTHTRQRSSCSRLDEDFLVECSIRSGLGGIVFTDHECLPPKGTLKRLNDKYHPFRVFTGIEICISMDDCLTCSLQDFIVVGLDNPILESSWSYDRLAEWVRKNGGWISWAHPFRYDKALPREIRDNPPDAMELYSNHIKAELAPRIRSVAEELGCQLVGVSDAHRVEDLGFSAVKLATPVVSDAELVRKLKKGAFELVKGAQ